MKLICFPHAGGFSTYYSFLRKYHYINIEEILVFDYPRQTVKVTGTAEDFRYYVDSAVNFILDNLDQNEDYALFGHSMGGFVACEAGIKMKLDYNRPPAGVIVSGQNPPYAVYLGKNTEIPKDIFEFAKQLGGVPKRLLNNPQLCERMYRIAEADIIAFAKYQPTLLKSENERLESVMLLRGDEDIIVDQKYLGFWNKTFKNIDSDTIFPGDHFYFNHYKHELSAMIDSFAGHRITEKMKTRVK